MITLPLHDDEIDLLKRALVEFRDSERGQATNYGPLHRAYELALRNADTAHEIFERLLYSNAVHSSDRVSVRRVITARQNMQP